MANYKEEQRKLAELEFGRVCFYPGCDKINEGFAHILPNRKWTVKRFGFKIVNHHSNLVPSCNAHNHRFQINATSEIELEMQNKKIKVVIENEK